jgi:hypothetical protein
METVCTNEIPRDDLLAASVVIADADTNIFIIRFE